MVTFILFGIGVAFLLGSVTILGIQDFKIKQGRITIPDGYNGHDQVSTTLLTIIRYALKRSVHFRKFCTQYVLHLMVRGMYYFDIFTTKMYAKSRNWFVQNAVKNKGSVPHFWEHLKVYKQEMDKERVEEEKDK